MRSGWKGIWNIWTAEWQLFPPICTRIVLNKRDSLQASVLILFRRDPPHKSPFRACLCGSPSDCGRRQLLTMLSWEKGKISKGLRQEMAVFYEPAGSIIDGVNNRLPASQRHLSREMRLQMKINEIWFLISSLLPSAERHLLGCRSPQRSPSLCFPPLTE